MIYISKSIKMTVLGLVALLSTAKVLCVGAGVLPYIKRHGQVFYLISQEHNGDWSDFGGGKDKKDKTIKNTAIREAYEESMGYFGDKHFWKKEIENAYHKKAYIESNGNYSYVIDITNNPKVRGVQRDKIIRGLYNRLDDNKIKLSQAKSHTERKKIGKFTEKKNFKFVDVSELKQMVRNRTYRMSSWKLEKLISKVEPITVTAPSVQPKPVAKPVFKPAAKPVVRKPVFKPVAKPVVRKPATKPVVTYAKKSQIPNVDGTYYVQTQIPGKVQEWQVIKGQKLYIKIIKK